MNKEIKEILEHIKMYPEKLYCLSEKEKTILLDYITNLEQENEELNRMCEIYSKSLYNADLTRYKSRIDKANWWLEQMLKQAKSEETKAIINGALELLLTGGDE